MRRMKVNALPSLLKACLWVAACGWQVCWLSAAEPTELSVEFNRDVRPILAEYCFACHGFDQAAREADLRLDTRAGALGELAGSPAILPGRPDESELIRRIFSQDEDMRMPPEDAGKQLTSQQKETLRLWIEQGASYETHWAFLPPPPSVPPVVAGTQHPIDCFIQARLIQAGLRLSPTADEATLIRRLSLDLTGLPPSPADVDEFQLLSSANANAAYDGLVERLLSSPHYGERWGRWWLDQARYADSNGYSIDAPRQIWKYRDWVIEAFNADMPFDAFTIEQLAGDLLPHATESQKIATGFHRNTQINQEGGIDKEQFRVDSVFDRVATTGTVWLGLSIGCAQCHDHKFDPVTQLEYYRLFAIFNNQDEPTLKVYGPDVDVDKLNAEWKAARAQLTDYLATQAPRLDAWEANLNESTREMLSANVQKALALAKEKRGLEQQSLLFAAALGTEHSFDELNTRYLALDQLLHRADTTLVMKERAEPRKTHLLIKGDFTRPAEEVTPGTPAVLHPFENGTGHANRLDLARWIVSPSNPLTARVIVNRVWQHYFGRGLVETENDFGQQGALPSHPELLDWLAFEWMQRGWSFKELHRLIVSSQTYRQSSLERPTLQAEDPENYLLGRQRRLRLDAEIVRDVALAACDLLSLNMGGPPVYPPIPEGVMSQGQVNRAWKVSQGDDRFRRGLYTFVYRATPPPFLNVFDAPDGFSTCTRRLRSNTPLQALTLLNGQASFEFAQALEEIIQQEGLEIAFQRCTARRPSLPELAILQQLDTLSAARALLNLDETLTRE